MTKKKLVIRQRRDRGQRGPQGPEGDSAFEVWLNERDGEGTYQEWIAELRGPRGERGPRGYKGDRGARGERGYTGSGSAGPPGPAGPAGPAADTTPKSTSLTRDGNGAVQTVAVAGGATWTISRNLDGSVAGLSDGSTDVAVTRAPDGSVSGTEVTEGP